MYLPGRGVRERYRISEMTHWRWRRDPALNFPRPMIINRRLYWRLEDLEQWERERAAGKVS